MRIWINSFGLILDIIGVIILFCYGFPYSGKSSFWTSPEMIKTDETIKERLRKFQRIAIFIIVFGFVLQLVSNFL